MVAVLAGMALAGAALGAVAQDEAAAAEVKAAEFNAAVSRNNAIKARDAAADALARGDVDSAFRARQTSALVGSQRAVLASKGIDVGTGSAAELQVDVIAQGKFDQRRIANNAAREALGFEQKAIDFDLAAQFGQQQAEAVERGRPIAFGASLLSGAASAGSFFKPTPKVPTKKT